MKKRVAIWALVGVVVLIGVLVVVLVVGRERVSLTLSHYHRWPHGATLKLSNDTSRTITYLTDAGGGIFLFQHKTPEGWTNASIPITSVMVMDRIGGALKPAYVFADPAVPLKPGPVDSPRVRELKPGRSTEIYVGLEPGGVARACGCCVQRSARTGRATYRDMGWVVEGTVPFEVDHDGGTD